MRLSVVLSTLVCGHWVWRLVRMRGGGAHWSFESSKVCDAHSRFIIFQKATLTILFTSPKTKKINEFLSVVIIIFIKRIQNSLDLLTFLNSSLNFLVSKQFFIFNSNFPNTQLLLLVVTYSANFLLIVMCRWRPPVGKQFSFNLVYYFLIRVSFGLLFLMIDHQGEFSQLMNFLSKANCFQSVADCIIILSYSLLPFVPSMLNYK